MSGLLKAIGKLLAFDLTGRTWTRQAQHPYFGEMTYFGSKKPESCYWEAEVALPDGSRRIGVTMTGTPEGPTKEEEQFCRNVVADLNALFERCRAGFEPVFQSWVKRTLPSNWREAFTLDGFQIPKDGNPSNEWEVCYFVEPAGHYFTAQFENGEVTNTAVDG